MTHIIQFSSGEKAAINTQQFRCLKAISRSVGATNDEMKQLYGIGDGSKRVSELINDKGLFITKASETVVNRYGEPCHIVRYSFKESWEDIT